MAQETLLRFETRVEPADLRVYYLYTVFIKPRWTVPMLVFAFGIGALLLPRGGISLWLGVALLVGVFWFCYSRARTWRRFRQASAGDIGIRYQVSINRQGLCMDAVGQEPPTRYRWDKVVEIWEQRRYFYIYHDAFSASILPKRHLSADETLWLRRFFQQKFAKKYHYMF